MTRTNDITPTWRWAFWALFLLSFCALVFPIWYGEMPPLTDFGSHVQLVHGAAGATDPGSVWFGLVDRAPFWQPNGVWVQLSAWLYPAIDPLFAMRFWFTLTLLVGAIGQVHLLLTFGRSRWLVFVALPFLTWNGMAALGFVNFVPALAILPWTMAAARRAASEDHSRRRDLVLLTLLPLLAVWFHGLGGLLVIGCSGFIGLLSLKSLRRGLVLTTFAPAAAYWLGWLLTTAPSGPAPSSRDGFVKWLATIRDEALGVFETAEGDITFYVLMGALLLFAVASYRRKQPQAPAPSPTHLASLLGWLDRHALAVLAVVLLVAYRALPRYKGDVALAERVIPALLLVVSALPGAIVRPWLGRVATVMAITAGLVFATLVGQATIKWNDEELGLAVPLIDQIPPNTRAQCVNVRFERPIFTRRTLDHGCNGVLAARRDVFAGGGFADTTHNAIRFKPLVPEHRIFDEVWHRSDELALVDYLLVRGPHSPPRPEWAESLGQVLSAQNRPAWTLYRSLLSTTPPITHEDLAGGDGGQPFTYQCPAGTSVDALYIGVEGEPSTLVATGVRCQKVTSAGRSGRISLRAEHARSRTVRCPDRQPLTGIEVYTDQYVQAVRPYCPSTPGAPAPAVQGPDAPGDADPDDGAAREDNIAGDGQPWFGTQTGHHRALVCPVGTRLTGLTGRVGLRIDRLGIRCSPAETKAP